MDIAEGHVNALKYLMLRDKGLGRLSLFNLGTGVGYSVLDVIKSFEKACGRAISYSIGPRREGDLVISFADASLAQQELGWKAKRSLDEMCRGSVHSFFSPRCDFFQFFLLLKPLF